MLTSPDFKELLSLLEKYEVRYLVVGGYAVMRYTEPRFTKDLDIWVSTDRENAEAVYEALTRFGAPLKDLTPGDFMQEGYFYQMGNPPLRLDVMSLEDAYRLDDVREALKRGDLKAASKLGRVYKLTRVAG